MMRPHKPARICLVPLLSGVGGMVSFQHKLATGLAARGVEVCYELAHQAYDAVLVIGGTRQIGGLWRARRRGVPIVQRLDGMNWVHRIPSHEGNRRTSLRHYLRAEYGNILLAFIRSRLADRIVYQSEFARRWWERIHGPAPVSNTVVHNGVDLDVYAPDGPHQRPNDRTRLLLVEGSLIGGYEMGLEVAVQLADNLAGRAAEAQSRLLPGDVELMVVGRVSSELRARMERQAKVPLHWAGMVARENIPETDRSAHLLYSADVNASCPNSVIEALACGLPVLAFDTGALPELVTGDSGRIVPYGGDPWQLDPPDVQALSEAALEILGNPDHFRRAARARAETNFGLDEMVDGYLQALLDA